jgi:DNA polymerase (family X)
MPRPNNLQIAEMLEQVAQLLEIKEVDAFRVAAYRNAARAVSGAAQPLWQVYVTQGTDGLRRIPGVGPTIGSAIQQYLEIGSVGMLERLKSEVPPEHLFTMLPGIGPELATRISKQLEIHTLEDLELAAHDGRLENLAGFGARRTKLVRDALAGILARSRPRLLPAPATSPFEIPPVELILGVDAEYRRGAQSGQLKRIAPRRFNPEGKAWLPLMQTSHQGWAFTALFSNTARAHELGMTRNWVVIFYERGQKVGQCTVVTERRGLMAGKRVVRGREAECRSVYFLRPASSPVASDHFPPDGSGPLAAAG